MSETKNSNNVIYRRDGRGDQWAYWHRYRVDSQYKMTDMDGMFGVMFFERDTSDQIFMEYITDGRFDNFGVTAIFERKGRIPELHEYGRKPYEMQRSFLCWLATIIGRHQRVQPRLLYAVNSNGGHSEWTLAEIDVGKRAATGRKWRLHKDSSWMDIWQAAGIVDVQNRLRELMP